MTSVKGYWILTIHSDSLLHGRVDWAKCVKLSLNFILYEWFQKMNAFIQLCKFSTVQFTITLDVVLCDWSSIYKFVTIPLHNLLCVWRILNLTDLLAFGVKIVTGLTASFTGSIQFTSALKNVKHNTV